MNSNRHELLDLNPVGRILCIDYGQQRIGLSASDPMQLLSSNLKTLANKGIKFVLDELADIIRNHSVVAIVVGMPYNMNGTIGERGMEVQEFIGILREKTGIPTVAWDERWTTISAHKTMHQMGKSPSKNRHKVDQIAASFILQSFLDRLSNLRRQNSNEQE